MTGPTIGWIESLVKNWRNALLSTGAATLPTAWTSGLAGALIAGGEPGLALAIVAVSLSFFHLGAWALDAAFGRFGDRRGSPAVLAATGAMLTTGGVATAFVAGPGAGVIGLFLAANIVLSGWLRRKTVLGPVMQAAARILFYVLAGAAVSELPTAVIWPALGLFSFTIGGAYATAPSGRARTDRIWPLALIALPLIVLAFLSVGDWIVFGFWLLLGLWVVRQLWLLSSETPGTASQAFGGLIAGIALYDAVLIALVDPVWAIAALAAFALVLVLDNWIGRGRRA